MNYDTAGHRNRINPFVIPQSIHSDHEKEEIAFYFCVAAKMAGYTNIIFFKEIFIDFHIIFK